MNIKSLVSFVSRLSKRERIIFYVTISVVGLVLLDRIILSPILSKIDSLNEAISTQEDAIKQSLLIVTQEERIDKETDRYVAYLSKPQTEEKLITAFLKEIETLAKKSSVYLIDIKPSGKSEQNGTTQHFLKLDFEAQMEEVFNFFYNVTNFKNLIKVEGFQIRPKSTGSSVIICTMSISKSIILE